MDMLQEPGPSWNNSLQNHSHDLRYKRLSRQRQKSSNIFALHKRELQNIVPNKFHAQMQITPQFIQDLRLVKELDGHTGCVNCLEFNEEGNFMLSGSDDYTICLWDIYKQKKLRSYTTGHRGNIFSVKYLPNTNDRLVVSGAADFLVEVRDLQLEEITHSCKCHTERVKRIATVPNVPNIFFSASEDGSVLQFDLRLKHTCVDLPKNVFVNVKHHHANAEVKCIAVNPVQPEYVAIGINDPYIRVYDRRMIKLTTVKYRGRNMQTLWDGDNFNHEQKSLPDNLVLGCAQYYVPGYLPDKQRQYRRVYRTLATTYLSYSLDGRHLLANLGGDNVNLFDTASIKPVKTYSPSVEVMEEPKSCPVFERNGTNCMKRPRQTEPFGPELDWLFDYARNYGIGCPPIENRPYESIEFYNKLILLHGNSAPLYAARASSKLSRSWEGDIYGALLDTEKALALDPDNENIVCLRSECLALLDRKDEARQFIEKWLQKFPHRKDYLWGKYLENMLVQPTSSDTPSDEENEGDSCKNKSSGVTELELEWRSRALDYEKSYCGHCNTTTDIKECVFLGSEGKYIAAGSDDGRLFIWDRNSTNLVRAISADSTIVNCVQSHPNVCLLATSGIESIVKLWSPLSSLPAENEPFIDLQNIGQKNQSLMRMAPIEMMVMPLNDYVDVNIRNVLDGDYAVRNMQCRTN